MTEAAVFRMVRENCFDDVMEQLYKIKTMSHAYKLENHIGVYCIFL